MLRVTHEKWFHVCGLFPLKRPSGMRKKTDHVTMYKACEELWEVIYSEHIPDQGAVKLRLRLVRGYRSWVEMARVV